jgi:hypothetical protein
VRVENLRTPGARRVERSMRPAAVLGLCAGCVIFPRSLEPPDNTETTVLLVTGTLGPPLDDVARHPWFAVRRAGETEWQIFEVGGGGTEEDPFDNSPYEEPILHAVWRGDEAAADCVIRESPGAQDWVEDNYIFYPGPNSNTFGDIVMRRCKLSGALPSTSVGKDWRGKLGFGAGITSERTGVQLETPIVGVKVGLKEGVELHFLGLSIGVDLWPPALIVPLGPGRLGFADR